MNIPQFSEIYEFYQKEMVSLLEDRTKEKGWNIKPKITRAYSNDTANKIYEIYENDKYISELHLHNSWLELLFLDRDEIPPKVNLRIFENTGYGLWRIDNIISPRIELMDAILKGDKAREEEVKKGLERVTLWKPDQKPDPSISKLNKKIDKIFDKYRPKIESEIKKYAGNKVEKKVLKHRSANPQADFTDFKKIFYWPNLKILLDKNNNKVSLSGAGNTVDNWDFSDKKLMAINLNEHYYNVDIYVFQLLDEKNRKIAILGCLPFDSIVKIAEAELIEDSVFLALPISKLIDFEKFINSLKKNSND